MDAAVNPRKPHGVLQLAIWTVVWVGTLALAMFGPALWGSGGAPAWIAIGLNLLAGTGWIVAHARYLHRLDDLQRKIQTDALAVALGVGLIGGLAASAAKNAGLLDFDSDLAVFSVVLGVVYMVAIVVGMVRYR